MLRALTTLACGNALWICSARLSVFDTLSHRWHPVREVEWVGDVEDHFAAEVVGALEGGKRASAGRGVDDDVTERPSLGEVDQADLTVVCMPLREGRIAHCIGFRASERRVDVPRADDDIVAERGEPVRDGAPDDSGAENCDLHVHSRPSTIVQRARRRTVVAVYIKAAPAVMASRT